MPDASTMKSKLPTSSERIEAAVAAKARSIACDALPFDPSPGAAGEFSARTGDARPICNRSRRMSR
jgi:hypothetical protein